MSLRQGMIDAEYQVEERVENYVPLSPSKRFGKIVLSSHLPSARTAHPEEDDAWEDVDDADEEADRPPDLDLL